MTDRPVAHNADYVLPTKHVVVCHSGGIDSTVLLYDLIDQGYTVTGFGVDYGQRHKRELDGAKALCASLGVEYVVATVSAPFLGSELTDGRGGVVVPNRNMVLLAVAGATAVSVGAQHVAIGCHAGDHELFPDCRPTFLEEAFRALRKGTNVGLLYPYARMTKAEIVARGAELGVPFDQTWSCYRGGDTPCGECLACTEREKALRPFVLEQVQNPHPKMLKGALEAQAKDDDFWAGYLRAMADATGESEEALIAWMERVG